MRVAGVNEDGKLGFPTDPPVSEVSRCLCLTFDSCYTGLREKRGGNKEMTASTEGNRRQEEKGKKNPNCLSFFFAIKLAVIQLSSF